MSARVLTLEEAKLLIGQEIGVGEWFTMTQEMINAFARLTHDHQWIHIDVDRAQAESPFGTTVAHGFLTLSMLSYLTREIFDITGPFKLRVNYGLNRVRFIAPIQADSRIRARVEVKEVEENGLVLLVTIESDGSVKPALVAEWITKFY